MSEDNVAQLFSLTGRTSRIDQHWYIKRLGVVEYDNLGFTDFLARIHTSEDKLLQALQHEETTERSLSCYQEWLFFGLLHEFQSLCPKTFSPENILVQSEEEGSSYLISFQELVNLLRMFCAEHLLDVLPNNTLLHHGTRPEEYTNIWPLLSDSLDNSDSYQTFLEREEHLASVTEQAFVAARGIHDQIAEFWKKDVDSPLA